MQLLAMVTMVIDHLGIVFFPGNQIWRIIGRLAFPLYAFGIAQGFRHTRSRKKYFLRLLVVAAVAQLPYMIGLHTRDINVVGTFSICLAVLMLMDRAKSKWIRTGVVLAAGTLLELLPFDYGSYALALILIYHYLNRKQWIAAHLMLNGAYLILVHPDWVLQLFSIVPTLLLAEGKQLARIGERIKLPRWIWRSFYPAHLVVLAVVVLIRHT